jgi:hypothetical protein
VVILFAWLLADFIAGVLHWAEDKLLLNPSRSRLIEMIRQDNILHHDRPGAICSFSYWDNIRVSAMVTLPMATILLLMGAPTLAWLTAFFLTFGNLTHRLAHEPKGRLHPIIRLLQKIGLLLSFKQHWQHHFGETGIVSKEEASHRYCPMSNWLNPILDKIKFFQFLDRMFGAE